MIMMSKVSQSGYVNILVWVVTNTINNAWKHVLLLNYFSCLYPRPRHALISEYDDDNDAQVLDTMYIQLDASKSILAPTALAPSDWILA